MISKSKKIIFFDLDGTLIDTNLAIGLSVQVALKKIGIRRELNELFGFEGKNIETYLEWVLREDKQNNRAKLHICISEYKKIAPRLHLEFSEIEDGLFEILEKLDSKANLVIISDKPIGAITSLLCHFKILHFFPNIFSSSEIKEPKPSPKILIDAIKFLEVKKENCVFVGNTLSDIITGNKAGVNVVLIGSNSINRDELKDWKYTFKKNLKHFCLDY